MCIVYMHKYNLIYRKVGRRIKIEKVADKRLEIITVKYN